MDFELKNYETLSEKQLNELLNYLDDSYYSGDTKISDSLYDNISDYYYNLTGKNKSNKIGTENIKSKVKLPIFMGSMDKLKLGDSKLKSFLNNYTNDKLISAKLDGNSLLIGNDGINIKAYTRGNGNYGTDVSDILPYVMSNKQNLGILCKSLPKDHKLTNNCFR